MTTATPFGERINHWVLRSTVPVYFTAWFLACRGDGLVLNAHGGLCAFGYTVGYMLALRRDHFALSADGVALPLALLGCTTSLVLFHGLALWPLNQRETITFVIKGMGFAYFLAHAAGAVVYVGAGTLLERIFKKRIAAEKIAVKTTSDGGSWVIGGSGESSASGSSPGKDTEET